jgi:hypothetical protein
MQRERLAEMTGPSTMMLNLWLAEALDQGCSGLRLVIIEVTPELLEQARRVFEERHRETFEEEYEKWPHLREARQADMAHAVDTDIPQFACMIPHMVTVLRRLPSGAWEPKWSPMPAPFADEWVRGIMSLAPNGTFILTRADDRPPLLVTMSRLEGEQEGLELSWEEMAT